jgi:hypothetical protein
MNAKILRAAAAAVLVLGIRGHAELINPGFEIGDLSGWSTFGQGWRISDGADARAGLHGVVNDVQNSDSDEWRGIYQELPVKAGARYDFSVFIRAVNVEKSASWLEIRWLDASDGIIQQIQSAHVTADQPFTYTELTGLVAPINAVKVSVRGIVRMLEPPGENTDFHIFDDFSVATEADIAD